MIEFLLLYVRNFDVLVAVMMFFKYNKNASG